jgi:hypothetical protein
MTWAGEKNAHPLGLCCGLQGWARHDKVLAKKSVQAIGEKDPGVF